jgi:hypothetical protein
MVTRTPANDLTSHPDRWCRGQHARFNSHYIQHYETGFERRIVVCHELGHTLGLRHRTTPLAEGPDFTTWGCMYPAAGKSGVTDTIDSHHRGHVNNHY